VPRQWATSGGSSAKLPSSSSRFLTWRPLSRFHSLLQKSQPPSRLSSQLANAAVPVCPLHYLQSNVLHASNVRLGGGGSLQLELMALSLNAWAQSHYDLGDAFGMMATEVVTRIACMPPDLQIRAIGMAYDVDPEDLVASPLKAEKPHREYYSTGNPGFTEAGVPDEYDTAFGSVIGYRTWKATPRRKGNYLLVGAYGKTWSPANTPGYRYTAYCEHRSCRNVPNEDNCGCGFWAYWEPSQLMHAGPAGVNHSVVGAIEGSGKVILGEKGFRSQHAVIRGLAFLGDFTGTDRHMLEEYMAPVFDSQQDLMATVGSDLVYSPAARDAKVFAEIPLAGLESYHAVMKYIMEVSQHCAYKPPSFTHWRSLTDTRSTHDTTMARREVAVVEKAMEYRVKEKLDKLTFWKGI
jgi:hypothetical protein